MKTLSDQITDLENTRAAKAAAMQAFAQKGIDSGETLDDADGEGFDTLSEEIAKIDKDLARLAVLQKMQIGQAVPVQGGSAAAAGASRAPVTVKNTQKLKPGQGFARYARCLLMSKGQLHVAEQLAKNLYADDENLNVIMKAAVAAGTTTDATWAGPLVQYQQYAGDFIEYLRPQTIIGQFGTNGRPSLRQIPFNVMIKGQTSGGVAGWVGQGAPKPLTKFDFNDVTLGIAKIAGIAVITDELARLSNPAAETLVQQGLAGCVIERMDRDFIDPDKAAVANVSPASITNGVTPISSSGSSEDNVRRDIQALFNSWITNNMNPQSAVLLMSPGAALALSLMINALGQSAFPNITMNGGTLLGIPVIVSQYLADHQGSSGSIVVLVSASDIYLADDGVVTLDVSREASIQMNDAPDSPPTAATVMVSMFQTNQMALRAERYINWGKRRANAVQYLDSVNWST